MKIKNIKHAGRGAQTEHERHVCTRRHALENFYTCVCERASRIGRTTLKPGPHDVWYVFMVRHV